MKWIKSSYCSGGDCVETALHDGHVLVRDSRDPSGPQLRFTAEEWAAFLAGAKAGEFDHLAAPRV